LRNEWGGKVILDVQDAWPETFYRLLPGSGKIRHVLAQVVFTLWRKQAQHAYAQADAITAVAWAYAHLSRAESRSIPLHVTPIGLALRDLDTYLPANPVNDSPFTFLYLGSISRSYDLEAVVRATKQLFLQGYKFRVIIAGTGPDEAYLKALVSSLNLASVVIFKGFLNFLGVANVLGESNVALNAISRDTYIAIPNKVADYLGAGLPIINSIPGELAILLQKYDAGDYYHAGDANSLANLMLDYLNNPDKVLIQGRNARKLAEALFDRERTYPTLVEFMEAA
jgi:glycosyltransferase involved in cell wall biosynthesis